MTTLFLTCAAFCLYVYFIFPLWLGFRAVRSRKVLQRHALTASGEPASQRRWPSVCIVIAAHNEASTLPVKIASLSLIDYPAGQLEVLFVSDGSTDESVAILQLAVDEHGWTLIDYPEAAGKPTALNTGVAEATAEILVFMDARQKVMPDAVKALVTALDDATVGVASGSLVLANDRGNDAVNVSLYWQYERWIRQNESDLHSTTGATGALYAVRRKDYVPHLADVLLDDFDLPICLLKRGFRTVFVPEAIVLDQAEADSRREFQRKVRTLAGNFQSFSRHLWLFDPRKNPVWWQFLSHKVFRLLVPYALLLAFVASLFGETPLLMVMLVVQILFYAVGFAGLAGIDNRPANIVKLILQLNAAAVVGGLRWLNGTSRVRWKQS